MATKRKTTTKKNLEDKIAELEAKLEKLSTQIKAKPAPKPAEPKPAETKPAEPKPAETKPAEPKPAETKPAEPKKDTLPKGSGPKPAPKPAEVPKPAEAKKQLPATFNEALQDAYYTAPMTDFHKYKSSVTGYSPAPNRYFVRRTAPVGKVPTTNWNDQKLSVAGYTQPSNQYFATRARMAYHPADKTFGEFSSVKMTVEGVAVQEKKQEPPKEAPKPAPKGKEQTQSPPPSTTTKSKSKTKQLEEYEKDYLKRLEQDRNDQQKGYEEELRKEAAESTAIRQCTGVTLLYRI
jgi:hypothetical protein